MSALRVPQGGWGIGLRQVHSPPWFKVLVSAADSAGTETDQSRHSDQTRTIHTKCYIERQKNYEKIMTNRKKCRHQNSCITYSKHIT